MPNKQTSRTRTKRNTNGSRGGTMAAAGPVWPVGNAKTELKTYAQYFSNQQLYHNSAIGMNNNANLVDNITQGTGVTTRIGNRIFVKRLRARFVLNNKTDRPNVSYRIAVTAAPTNTNTDSFGELFASGTFSATHVLTNSLLLYDTVFPLNQGSGMDNNVTPNKERSFNHVLELPINRPVVYNVNDGKASTCITVWLIAYDAFGTLTTDNIASVASCTWALDYTDA